MAIDHTYNWHTHGLSFEDLNIKIEEQKRTKEDPKKNKKDRVTHKFIVLKSISFFFFRDLINGTWE